jgi:CRP-like cAMP-binding protein
MGYAEKTRVMDRLEARLALANSQFPQSFGLAGIPLFRALPAGAIVALEDTARWMRFQPGEPVLKPDRTGAHGVYVILEGRVETYLTTENGTAVVLAELGRGQWFGEFAAIDGKAGSAAVRAKEAAVLAEIPRDAFTQLLRRYPEVTLRLTEHLVGVVRALDERVSSLQGFQDKVDRFHRRLRVSVI